MKTLSSLVFNQKKIQLQHVKGLPNIYIDTTVECLLNM